MPKLDGTFRFMHRFLRRPRAQIGIGKKRVRAPRTRIALQCFLKVRNCIPRLVFPQQLIA
jgi:hypothetical protein